MFLYFKQEKAALFTNVDIFHDSSQEIFAPPMIVHCYELIGGLHLRILGVRHHPVISILSLKDYRHPKGHESCLYT
jgi:hypothetical protein